MTEADSGMYSISCENDVGIGQATLELSVIPSEPEKQPESCQKGGPPSELIIYAIDRIIIIYFFNEGRRDVRLALQGITKEWDDLAEALGLPDSDIDVIKTNNPSDVKQCVKEVVDQWFKGKGSEPPSWTHLCTALRDSLVNRKDIALKIEKDNSC